MKETGFNKKNGMIIIGIIIACMAIGSFADYQISTAIFNIDSWFGKILAAYGQLPTSLGFVVASTLMIMATEKRMKLTTILSYVGGALLIAMGVFMACLEPTMYIKEVPTPVLTVITLAIIVGVDAFVIRLVKGANREDIKRFVKFAFFVIVLQTLVINIVKVPWARPRMRMIAVTPEAAFQPWWVIGSGMKETLMATAGIAAEEFKSFPSGHTGCATSLVVISMLPTISRRLEGKENTLFWVGIIFGLVVAFSRIIMGAHFLTDVTVGFSITCLMAFLGYRIFYYKK